MSSLPKGVDNREAEGAKAPHIFDKYKISVTVMQCNITKGKGGSARPITRY